MGTIKNFWGSSLDCKKSFFRFCIVLFLFFCFLSSGFAQNKAQLNQYLIGWVRNYWPCQGKGCYQIRNEIQRSKNAPDHLKENLLALQIAAEKGYDKIAKAMIDEGTPIESRFGISNATPLMLAAGAGHLNVVKLLVARGADPEAQSFDATPPGSMSPWDYGVRPFIGTPVMWARKGGHYVVAGYLIFKGAKPHPKIKGSQ